MERRRADGGPARPLAASGFDRRTTDNPAAMSDANVEVVRSLYRALEAGDVDAFIDCLDPDVEWMDLAFGPWPGKHIGLEEMRDWFEIQMRHISEGTQVRVPFDEVRTAGDKVIVTGRGAELADEGGEPRQAAWLFTIRDRKVRAMIAYANYEEALEAAGLSE